jgi:hypothetical protein
MRGNRAEAGDAPDRGRCRKQVEGGEAVFEVRRGEQTRKLLIPCKA